MWRGRERCIPRRSSAFQSRVRLSSAAESVQTANAFLKELAKPGVAAKFIAYDLPADFVTDLQADLAAIGVTGEEQIEDKREDADDTEKIRGLIKEGNDLLKILNTSVTNKFRDQPAALAEWQTGSHIRRRKGDDKKRRQRSRSTHTTREIVPDATSTLHNTKCGPLRPAFFMHRRLRQHLPAEGPVVIKGKRTIHGMGGVSKTCAAIEYAWKHADAYRAHKHPLLRTANQKSLAKSLWMY